MCPKLAHRRRLPSPEVPQEWMTAHSELQELRGGEKDDKTAMSANTKNMMRHFVCDSSRWRTNYAINVNYGTFGAPLVRILYGWSREAAAESA